MGRLAERTAVRLAIFALLALVIVWPMLAHAGFATEFRDAQVLTLHEQAAVAATRDYGQIPLWDPWYCGGLYGLGAPQSRFAAPPFLLSLLFGVERAQPIVVWLFTVLGMEGTFRWLRLRVNDATAVIRIVPLFALSGHFAVAWGRGWINFFGFVVPFVLYGITQAARGRTHGIAVAAIAFACVLGYGGTFAAPLIAVAAVVESIRALLEAPPARRGRALLMMASVASFMVAVAAVRLLPIAETLNAQPRIMAGTPGHAPMKLLSFLVKSLDIHPGSDIDDPGVFYVGGAFLALIALGGAERKSIRPLFIVILFMWLAAGYARRPALFALLREIPVFAALRYPERFLWLGILFACEPAANALSKVPRLGEGKSWRQGAHVVLTLAVLVSLGQQIRHYYQVEAKRDRGAIATEPGTEFRQARGNRWLAGHYQGLNLGSLSCWEAYPVTMSPLLRGDLAQEEYVEDINVGYARRVSWSPNKVVVHATMHSPGRLFINQNWHPGWRASVGNVVSVDGLLAVDLPAGESDVTLTFRPMSAIAGGAMTLAALLALILLGIGARPFRRGAVLRTGALVVLPWAVLGAFVATWTEPQFPPAPTKNANGSPALVTNAAPDAVPVGAKFEIPIEVESARVVGPTAYLDNLDIDLWLRRTGSIPRTTGMFIHVRRREGQEPIREVENRKDREREQYNVDHQVVGGSFYVSDAPEGILIHDAFGVHLDKAARGKWDIWLGFGNITGKRGRARVTDHGKTDTNDDMIRIGSFEIH